MTKYDINPLSLQDFIDRLPPRHSIINELASPRFDFRYNDVRLKLGLAVHSMSTHTSDEGWEIFKGLEENGYILAGHDLQINLTDVKKILNIFFPGTIVVQDKREWEGKTAGRGFNNRERFTNIDALHNAHDVFKLTILKDAHQDNGYHASSASEMGCHAWICYYHPLIVKYLAPYVRFKDIIRTYHTIDKNIVPDISNSFQEKNKREGCLLSGAVSSSYPLRSRLVKELSKLVQTTYFPHPGYGRARCHTPEFMKLLCNYKISICTSSMYGYLLRKIPESTACGCIVITDLPRDEKVPFIDENLVRIHPDTPTEKIKELIQELINSYDPEKQLHFSNLAKEHYDYRVVTHNLVQDIENMKLNYTT